MDLDGLAQDERVEQVALQLDGENQCERHHHGHNETLGHQRHQDDHDPGHEHANQWDQRTKEQKHAKGNHQRHTGNEHDHDHGERVDQCEQHGAAHVGDQRVPGHVAGVSHPGLGLIREEPHHPPPDASVVGQQEQGREQAEDGPADDDECAVGGGKDTLGQAGPVLGDGLGQIVDQLLDLVLRQFRRACDQPLTNCRHGVQQLDPQLGGVGRDLLNDEPGGTDQRGHAEHEHQDRRRDPGDPIAHQHLDTGL